MWFAPDGLSADSFEGVSLMIKLINELHFYSRKTVDCKLNRDLRHWVNREITVAIGGRVWRAVAHHLYWDKRIKNPDKY